MLLHLHLICLLDFLFIVTAKPLAPELYISKRATISLNNRPLVGRSPQHDNLFSDNSNAADVSVFVDNPELFPPLAGASGNELALLDSEDHSIDQGSPELDLYDEDPGLQAAQDPENLDMFVGSIGETAELPTSCEGGNNLDSYVDDPNMLTGRNLIDDFFNLRIPDEILAPKGFCPNPQDTKKSSPQSTEHASKLPFRVPLPDLAGKRCRIENGEGPMYALCCFMEGNGNQENACYPGNVVFLLFWFLRLSLPSFVMTLNFPLLRPITFHRPFAHVALYFGYYFCFYVICFSSFNVQHIIVCRRTEQDTNP